MDFCFTESPLISHFPSRDAAADRHFVDLIRRQVQVRGKLGKVEVFHKISVRREERWVIGALCLKIRLPTDDSEVPKWRILDQKYIFADCSRHQHRFLPILGIQRANL